MVVDIGSYVLKQTTFFTLIERKITVYSAYILSVYWIKKTEL